MTATAQATQKEMQSQVDSTPMAAVAQPRMSVEEFLRWEHQGIAELVNGEVIIMSVKEEHQRILQFLFELLAPFIRVFNLGLIRLAPYAMRAVAGGNVREPDLIFVSTANAQRITSSLLEGPADLAIEVVSDGSVEQDYDVKLAEYQNAGVREYWIIDPRADRLRASFFVLDAQQRYRPIPVGDDGIYHSTAVPGFWLKVAWLWLNPLPNVDALQLVIGGAAYIEHLQNLIEQTRSRPTYSQR
jgi:Uma2 family endonuclease